LKLPHTVWKAKVSKLVAGVSCSLECLARACWPENHI